MDQIIKNRKPFFIPFSTVLLLFLVMVGITFGIALDFSLLLPILLGSAIGLFILFHERPLIFLAVLIIARMSLDYSSQYISFSFYDITLTLSQILGLGVALVGVYCLYIYQSSLQSFKLTAPFALIILWGIFSLLFSVAPGSSLTEIIRIFDFFVIAFLAFLFVKTKADYNFLLKALFLSALIPSVVALYQYINNIGFSDADVSIPRIFGTFAHPNTLSLYLFTMLVVCTLYYTWNEKTLDDRHRFFFFAGSFFLGFLLFLTFARVAWIITFFFILVMAVTKARKLLVPLILIPLILILLSTSFQDRIRESLSPDPDSSIVWRQNLWADVIQKTAQDDRRLTGSGINTFPLITENLRGPLLGSNDAHNDFVKFYVEGGIIGLFIFCLYLFLLFHILFQVKKTVPVESPLLQITSIMIVFLACLTLASLSDNIFKNTPVQWIFFALYGALLSLVHEMNTKKDS
jgi:O-antigen ligase